MSISKVGDPSFRGHTDAHGIEDASSAIEAAIGITNRHGMSQPNTMPTCPPLFGIIREYASPRTSEQLGLTRPQRKNEGG